MTLLVTRDALLGRRSIAGGPFASLTKGLRAELEPLVRSSHEVPTAKALLSREGGRCTCDGGLLDYQPFDARHRCPRCGREHSGERHDRFRLYWHQLWLAERTVHAALLGVLLDDASCRATAMDLLDAYAGQYLHYPAVDNVLGPSRPFFSTYIESIWLLQLCVAIDLLELGAPSDSVSVLGGRLRAHLVAPSAALIASYGEGMSNRQVWNNAALFAAGTLLGDDAMRERALFSDSGLTAHLDAALLDDGSWYEGENYHMFAHRGLWYGVQMAATAGIALPPALLARFDAGFIAPLRTVLPDLTYPSRRDSQYAVSVRQLRVAESCELGVARGSDDRLLGWLGRLYDPAVPRRETGRASTTAEIERNLPATGLTRSDLSWRTLLFAREHLPALKPQPLESDLLPAQGIGILRRDGGAIYAAIDYGHSGGGHGHPDRLNLLLSDGASRWADDPGTGSYVDDSLHWYRSTLAHSAPLVDGRSQPRVHGTLQAYGDDGRIGWVSAAAELVPGLRVRRSIVLMESYLVDELTWDGDETHEVALPLHGVELLNEQGTPIDREPATITGGTEPEDGFAYLADTMHCATPGGLALVASDPDAGGIHHLRGWVSAGRGTSWWSASAPRAPGLPGRERMLLLRRRATSGRIVTVWSWRESVTDVERSGDAMVVTLRSGDRHVHRRTDLGWRVETSDRVGAHRAVDLGGPRAPSVGPPSILADSLPPLTPELASDEPSETLPFRAHLDEESYRRSELTWHEAGAPQADIRVLHEAATLVVEIEVMGSHRIFVPANAENPYDNEPAAINGDGVQLYLVAGEESGAWLLVPRDDSDDVATHHISGWGERLRPSATWRATERGYLMRAEIPLALGAEARTPVVELDVIINETAPGRERRRGQLVLSGAGGEFVYLRGDRHDRARLLRFSLADA